MAKKRLYVIIEDGIIRNIRRDCSAEEELDVRIVSLDKDYEDEEVLEDYVENIENSPRLSSIAYHTANGLDEDGTKEINDDILWLTPAKDPKNASLEDRVDRFIENLKRLKELHDEVYAFNLNTGSYEPVVDGENRPSCDEVDEAYFECADMADDLFLAPGGCLDYEARSLYDRKIKELPSSTLGYFRFQVTESDSFGPLGCYIPIKRNFGVAFG